MTYRSVKSVLVHVTVTRKRLLGLTCHCGVNEAGTFVDAGASGQNRCLRSDESRRDEREKNRFGKLRSDLLMHGERVTHHFWMYS